MLREMRLQAGLSMRKAGRLMGCTDSYISHIENGRTNVPTGIRLERFLAAYGGIKTKSFYERVRRFSDCSDPRQELFEIIKKLPIEKIKLAIQILNNFI